MPPDNSSQQPANNTPGVLGPPPGQSFTGGGKKGINKTPLIIAGALILILLVFIVGAVLLNGNRKPKSQTNQSHETSDVDPEGPQPAAALDVEQASNSITQDITSLNDDEDFPATKLDSDALDL